MNPYDTTLDRITQGIPVTYQPYIHAKYGDIIWISAVETVACIARAYGLIFEEYSYMQRVCDTLTVSSWVHSSPQLYTLSSSTNTSGYEYVPLPSSSTSSMSGGPHSQPQKYTKVTLTCIPTKLYDAIMQSHIVWGNVDSIMPLNEIYYNILVGAGVIDASRWPRYTQPVMFTDTASNHELNNVAK